MTLSDSHTVPSIETLSTAAFLGIAAVAAEDDPYSYPFPRYQFSPKSSCIALITFRTSRIHGHREEGSPSTLLHVCIYLALAGAWNVKTAVDMTFNKWHVQDNCWEFERKTYFDS